MTRQPSIEWQRYGGALIRAMAEVLRETPEESHPLLLETADYWLSLGLALGIARPNEARRLLDLLLSHDEQESRAELEKDGVELCGEVLQ